VAVMARYQVMQIRVESCPLDASLRHITEVQLDGIDGSHRVGVSVARLMLSADDNLVAESTASGAPADVRKSRCVCGFKSIRTVNGGRTDDDMSTLPVLA
jgi:hypothetical protein